MESVPTHAACEIGCGEDFLQEVQQLWSWVVRQLLPLAVMKVWHISVVSGRQMNSLHQGPREALSDWTIGYHPGKGDWCKIASFVGNHCICSSVGVQVVRSGVVCLKRSLLGLGFKTVVGVARESAAALFAVVGWCACGVDSTVEEGLCSADEGEVVGEGVGRVGYRREALRMLVWL